MIEAFITGAEGPYSLCTEVVRKEDYILMTQKTSL